MMLDSLEQVEDRAWSSNVKNLGAISSIGYATLQPTPVTLITAIGLSILVIAQTVTRWTFPKSLRQHIVTKLTITLSLALVSALALKNLLNLPSEGTSFSTQVACCSLPTLSSYGIELIVAYLLKNPLISLTPEEFRRDLENRRNFHHLKVSVRGGLDLSDCTGLISLPQNLSVGRFLDLVSCTGLTSLPENLNVAGDLDLTCCTSLTSLPENLSVGGSVDLRGCTGLTSLGKNLNIGGGLLLNRCTSLTSPPENLSIGMSLSISWCENLTSLPENLSVGRDLYLRGCTGLTSLPENLRVGWDLNLGGCTGLTSLSENLNVGRDLNLSGCTGLTSLPNWITTLGRTVDGDLRHVYLQNTGLSDAEIDRLRRTDAPGVQFHFSRGAAAIEVPVASRIEEGLLFWKRYLPEESEVEVPSIEVPREREVEFVCRYLARLTNTAEYKNLTTRSFLAERVLRLFQAMSEDDELKEILLRVIEAGLETCDDRVASSFDQMELKVRLHQAEEKAKKGISEEELRILARGLVMLKKVEEKAKEHMETLSSVDEIEVLLAFQIGLRERLALPLLTQNMIFRRFADVTDEQIVRAGDAIEKETTEEEIQRELESMDAWKIYLRRKEVKPYNELPEAETIPEGINWECPLSAIDFIGEDEGHPVLFMGVIVDYDLLTKTYINSGKDPFTNNSMKWSDIEVRRVRRPERVSV